MRSRVGHTYAIYYEDNGTKFKDYWFEEYIILKVIGIIQRGFTEIRRLNRMLPIGHRFRGDVLC